MPKAEFGPLQRQAGSLLTHASSKEAFKQRTSDAERGVQPMALTDGQGKRLRKKRNVQRRRQHERGWLARFCSWFRSPSVYLRIFVLFQLRPCPIALRGTGRATSPAPMIGNGRPCTNERLCQSPSSYNMNVWECFLCITHFFGMLKSLCN